MIKEKRPSAAERRQRRRLEAEERNRRYLASRPADIIREMDSGIRPNGNKERRRLEAIVATGFEGTIGDWRSKKRT